MSERSIVPSGQSNNPLQFVFDECAIRIITDENGDPLFVAADVCKALAISDVKQAIERLDSDERGRYDVLTGGGIQSSTCVTEAGLYRLIFTSRKEQSERFKRWIAHDVLPSIRKTGSYAIQKSVPTGIQALRQLIDELEAHQNQLDSQGDRITTLEERIQPQYDYFTIIGYYRKQGLAAPSMNEAQRIGQMATRLSREKGYGIGKTSDPRFGEVNSYHVSILSEIIKR